MDKAICVMKDTISEIYLGTFEISEIFRIIENVRKESYRGVKGLREMRKETRVYGVVLFSSSSRLGIEKAGVGTLYRALR